MTASDMSSTGTCVNPMKRSQACFYKHFTIIHMNLWMQVSYDAFLLVFTRKFYKDFVPVEKTGKYN